MEEHDHQIFRLVDRNQNSIIIIDPNINSIFNAKILGIFFRVVSGTENIFDNEAPRRQLSKNLGHLSHYFNMKSPQ